MDTLFRIIFYLVVGIFLITTNYWFVHSLRNEFFGGELVIAPFLITGQKDDDGTLGMTLAQMLQARLRKIQQDLVAFQSAVIEVSTAPLPPQQGGPPTAILPLWPAHLVDIPIALLEPININVAVGGVDVGGVFPWLQRRIVKTRTLSFTVSYGGENTVITGNLDALAFANTTRYGLSQNQLPITLRLISRMR